MKATLNYELPDEQEEFQDAINGIKWKSAMWDLDQHLRGLIKHAPDSMDEMEHQAYKKVRSTLHEIVINHGINFDL